MVSTISIITIIAAAYGQNKHAHADLRKMLGLEMVRVLWGLIHPVKLRAAAKLPW